MSFSDLYTILTWLSNKIKTQASHTVFIGSFLIWSLCPRSHLPLPSLQHTVIQTNWFSLCCPNPWDLFYVEAFALPVLSSWLPLSCTLTLWASPSASISVQTSEDIFQSQWWPSNLVQAFNLIHLFISLCFVFCKQVSLSHVISFIRFHLLSFSIIAQRQHEFKRNMELEEMALWITTLTLLIWESEFEPPALTEKAWHAWPLMLMAPVLQGRDMQITNLPGQPASPKAVSFWFSKRPCLKAKR